MLISMHQLLLFLGVLAAGRGEEQLRCVCVWVCHDSTFAHRHTHALTTASTM